MSGSFIDKFAYNSNFPYTFSNILNIPSFSDHNAIQISIIGNFTTDLTKNNFFIKKYNYVNIKRMNKYIENKIDLINIPINKNLSSIEIENTCENFGNILNETANKFVPTEILKTNNIILSYSTIKVLRFHHSLQRKLHRNIKQGTNTNSISEIKRNIILSRIMLHKAIAYDLNNYYRNVLVNTRTTRDAFSTVKFHTGYKKRLKIPNILYTDENKNI